MEDRVIAALKQVSSLVKGFACYIVASADGKIIAQGGDCSALKEPWLLRMLFGDKEEIISTFDFLDGNITPLHYRQGDVRCVLLKPTGDIVVGIFYQGSGDPLLMYEEGVKIGDAFNAKMQG